jgi:hypothetical protein
MPMFNLLDKLARGLRLAPFKCRACRAKFYRPLPPREDPPAREVHAPPVVAAAPVRFPAVRRKDRADTLRRIENLIRNAQGLRAGKR